jgi:outer membrane protein
LFAAGCFWHVASEVPQIDAVVMSYQEGTEAALTMSPDLLRGRRLVAQEELRVKVARNQRLPQVDLRASFSSAGLGYDWDSALADVERARFPQWVVGVDVRIPITAGVRTRSELASARHRLRQAEYDLADMEAGMRTQMDAFIRRVQAAERVVNSYRAAVASRQALLNDRMTGRSAGRVDARTVLEAEEELVVSRLQLRDSEVEYERALLEMQLLQGRLLQNRGLEMTMADLEAEAKSWFRRGAPEITFLRYRDPVVIDGSAGPAVDVDGQAQAVGWLPKLRLTVGGDQEARP